MWVIYGRASPLQTAQTIQRFWTKLETSKSTAHLALLIGLNISGFRASLRREPLEDVAAVVGHVGQHGALLHLVAAEDDLGAEAENVSQFLCQNFNDLPVEPRKPWALNSR